MYYRLFLVFFVVFSLISCRSKKGVNYFQNSVDVKEQSPINYEPKIQPDDVLSIEVTALDEEVVKVFNKQNNNLSTNSTAMNYGGYLVNHEGYIEFPVLGTIKVSGYSKTSLLQLFKEKLALYVTDPVVNIRLLNFNVTVLGEIGSPGTYTFTTERVTLTELLSTAGDFTLQSKRDNVLIVREVDGVKTFNRIDVTQASIINSPFYYMAQNDVVYVEPRKNKIDSGAIPPALLNTISVFTLFLTTLLLVRNIKI